MEDKERNCNDGADGGGDGDATKKYKAEEGLGNESNNTTPTVELEAKDNGDKDGNNGDSNEEEDSKDHGAGDDPRVESWEQMII